MADFLSKIFLLSPQKSENNHLGEASLMQGARFNKMQSAIESPVYPHLALMEQTTGAGLGSIKEPLENNSQLPSLDKNEMHALSKMEKEYEHLIEQLQKEQKKYRKDINMMGTGKNDFKKIKTMVDKIQKKNKAIMKLADKIIKKTYKANDTTRQLNEHRDLQRQDLKNQVDKLMKRKQGYDALMRNKNSLESQYQDRQNELDAAYLHYIVWFVAATTLGILTVRQLSK
jgi:DNA repair exonuclease SbcCD ATPase subunit